MGEIPCSKMKKIEFKGIDVINNVIQEMAVKLDYLCNSASARAIWGHEACAYKSLTHFWVENYEVIKQGGCFCVASFVKDGSDNYHFASEELIIASTVLSSGNVLIELGTYTFEDWDANFAFPTVIRWEKAYIVEM